MQLTLLLDGKHELGEGIRWCERTQRVFWTDIQGAKLWCHSPISGTTQSWVLPERMATYSFTNDVDCLLLGFASRLAFFNLATSAITPICTIEADLPTTRLNDGRCDRQGRFVFGTLNESSEREPIGSYYRLNTDLTLEQLALPHTAIPNSICFSIDGCTMYYCDSMHKAIWCCAYDPVSGAVQNSRIFADLSDQPGSPDGSTIDADGYLWNAQWGGARVVRFAPDGSIERMVSLPVDQPSCPTFGGANLDELFVTSAHESMSDEYMARQPLAGSVFHAKLEGIKGLLETRFGGTTPA
ncbi:MAG: SMP-30/gluconolactonase/LRE family protein [Pseudomonadota bacterium]